MICASSREICRCVKPLLPVQSVRRGRLVTAASSCVSVWTTPPATTWREPATAASASKASAATRVRDDGSARREENVSVAEWWVFEAASSCGLTWIMIYKRWRRNMFIQRLSWSHTSAGFIHAKVYRNGLSHHSLFHIQCIIYKNNCIRQIIHFYPPYARFMNKTGAGRRKMSITWPSLDNNIRYLFS